MLKKNLIGQLFGKLTVIRYNGRQNNQGSYLYECLCSCGESTFAVGADLLRGHKKSCGCLNRSDYGKASAYKLYYTYKRLAEHRNLTFEINFEYFLEVTQQSCFYCGIEPKQSYKYRNTASEFIYNGIDRKNNSMGYTKSNILPCCKACNYGKHDMPFDEWILHLKRIARKWQE